jgi:ABC-type multidrug transport system fused ATPase/permease subunit
LRAPCITSCNPTQVLKNFQLSVRAGQSVALVGPSGCGKSTCISLLQRFYDLSAGEISLEQHDLQVPSSLQPPANPPTHRS